MTDTAPVPAHEAEHADEHHDDHASDTLYIQIALGLAVLTGMEVAWPYIVDDGPILMFPLLIVMAIKFVIIAAFFMHLKFDSKILTRVFYSGLFLAVGVYIAALCTFRIFQG
jgi:cytochrome c oxidase subunit IV